MVQIEIINKSITDAIIKCSQGLTLNNSVKKVFDKFHNETCGKKIRKTEKGFLTDNKGNILYEPKGNKKEVNVDWSKVQDLYEEYGDLHFTHNHPRDGVKFVAECLSGGDVDCLFLTYRPYGKRPDGSEGYLVGEEGVYYTKSISCESANGSRMTLVRGDNFKRENENEATSLGRKLSDYWDKYTEDYYNIRMKLFSDAKMEDFNGDVRAMSEYAHKEALKQVGVFEKNKEFKDIQKAYSDIDCKLTYTFPVPYEVDY